MEDGYRGEEPAPEPEGPTTGHDFVLEEAEDALLEGDRTAAPGTIRTALAHPDFRTLSVGMFLSNTGTWMQNVIAAAFAFELTHSPLFVSFVGFANLGPQLLLSLIGGAIADAFDRGRLIVWLSVEQMLASLLLAWIVRGSDPSQGMLLAAVAIIGTGAALQAPVFLALTPSLVPRRDLAGAISVNSVSMNISRVMGPAIGGVLYATVGATWVFVGNAVTYLFIIVAVMRIRVPRVLRRPARARRPPSGLRLRHRPPRPGGDPLAGDVVLFSFFSLSFLVQMPVLAEESMGIAAKSTLYGLLYAVFGIGAVVGALSIGTFLAGRSLELIVRLSLAGFAVSLAAFALVRTPAPAFPVGLIVGFCYFATVTSLATVFQSRLDDEVRGRVSALWVMAFGGTVPIGGLFAGWLADISSITVAVLLGAAVAGLLVWYADLRPPADEPDRALSA